MKRNELCLPIYGVETVMKEAMPDHHPLIAPKIPKDVKELMQLLTTEFISFVTSDVIDDVGENSRMTIKGCDILNSLDKLGFSHYVPLLKLYQDTYQETLILND